MAVPDIVPGGYANLMIGDGAATELFTILCGLTTRSFTEQVNTNDTFIGDCADPAVVPFRRLVATGKQWDLSGEGRLNRTQLATMRAASGVSKNYRFVLGRPTGEVGTGFGYYAGKAMLTNIQIVGNSEGGEFQTISLAIASDGLWTWTEVPA